MRGKRYKTQASRYLPKAARKGKRLAPPPPYRSWLEADVAKDLEDRGVKFEYESKKLVYVEPAQVRTYTPDLVIGYLIVEVKGRWTAADRRKMGFVIEQNPDTKIHILFAKDNYISKNSRTKYSDWCEKRGITYAIGESIPEAWFKEAKNDKS